VVLSPNCICNQLSRYVSIVNEVVCGMNHACKSIQYDLLQNRNMNYDLPIVGSGNCLVCCILFMFYYVNGYNVEDIDNILCMKSKTILTQHHIALYNTIGDILC
jgi:hypothetical protein